MGRKPKLGAGTAAVLDPETGDLSVNYRRAVAAALPDEFEPSGEFWRDLQAAVVAFIALSEGRKRRPATAMQQARDHWINIKKQTAKLRRELAAVRPTGITLARPMREGSSGPIEYVSVDALAILAKLEDRAAALVDGYSALIQGGDHALHLYLYRGVLDVWLRHVAERRPNETWREHMTRELRSSNPSHGGQPSGPLIDFFTACITPFFELSPHGMATIIDEYRRRK